MTIRRTAFITVLAISLASCGGADLAGDPPATTTTGGDIVEPTRETPGPATVEHVEVLFSESDPVHVTVVVRGTMPTPCHNLVVEANDDTIVVSSLFDPLEACIQVIEPFQHSVDLGPKAEGTHTVVVNGVAHGYAVGDDTGCCEPDPVAGPAFVDDVQFVFLESYPVQVHATISGHVPTPCHSPDAAVDERDGNRIQVTVGSTVAADAVCAQVLEPFEITLPIGSFESGDYVVEIDGAEFPFTI